MRLFRTLMAALFIGAAAQVAAQVNTEAMRKSEIEDGFYTRLVYNFQISKGNFDYWEHRPEFRVDHKNGSWHSFFIINLTRADKFGERFINQGVAHLRIVKKITRMLSMEVFGQYDWNDFILMDNRYLTGGGLRLRLLHYPDKFDMYIASGAMGEWEYYLNNIEPAKKLLRSTSYVTLKYMLSETVRFDYTQYFQFDTQRITDYRTIIDASLTFMVNKVLSFQTVLNYRFDNEPVPTIKDYDITIRNGLVLSI